jgi:hypothetical protein
MLMKARSIAKFTSLYERGLLSAVEMANALLFQLVSEPELDVAFLSSVDSLPQGVATALRALLRRIMDDDYRWSPFLLTSAPVAPNAADMSAKLRRICGLLRLG